MKAEELMIGEHIKHGFGGTGKVTELSKGIVTVYDKGLDDGEGNCEVNFAENEIQPIPLTPEILEKNGFTKELDTDGLHYRFTLIDGNTKFSILYARSVFQWFSPLDFKYVHELQHALRLCGLKKGIKVMNF